MLLQENCGNAVSAGFHGHVAGRDVQAGCLCFGHSGIEFLKEELSAAADAEQAELVEAVLAKGKPGQPALDKTYEIALDQKHTAIADLLKKAGAHEPAPPVVLDPKIIESYAGTYKSDQIPLEIKVFLKDGKLYLQATGQSEFAPKAKSPTSFEFTQYQLQVDFDSAASFTLKQGGREFKFKKAVAQ